jgi:hypothetical protein
VELAGKTAWGALTEGSSGVTVKDASIRSFFPDRDLADRRRRFRLGDGERAAPEPALRTSVGRARSRAPDLSSRFHVHGDQHRACDCADVRGRPDLRREIEPKSVAPSRAQVRSNLGPEKRSSARTQPASVVPVLNPSPETMATPPGASEYRFCFSQNSLITETRTFRRSGSLGFTT